MESQCLGLGITSGTQSEVVLCPPWVWIKNEFKWDEGSEVLRLDSLFSVGLTSRQSKVGRDIHGMNECVCHHSQLPSAGQFIILVIDSTDRDRLLTTREELYKMLAHEVSSLQLGKDPGH